MAQNLYEEANIQSVAHRSTIQNQNPVMLQSKSWPSDFNTVKGTMLQDLIVRYIRDGLAFAEFSRGNRLQKEAHAAIQVVSVFVEMSSLPSAFDSATEAAALAHCQSVSAFARRVHSRIVAFIEEKRTCPNAKNASEVSPEPSVGLFVPGVFWIHVSERMPLHYQKCSSTTQRR